MKFVLAAFLAVFSVSALAQKHMVNFDAGEIAGALKWSTGSNMGEEKAREVTFNYAYTLVPKFQIGAKTTYKYDAGSEAYALKVGGIYNLSEDIRSSFYGSAFVGMGWFSTVGQEVKMGELAVGKRIPLSFINNENFVYSPEVAWTSMTATNTSGYGQQLAIKFLNFSLFF